jgi:hypothetical protein
MVLNGQGHPYIFFDLKEDPQEQHNLAGASRITEVERKLSLTMLEHLVQTPVLFDT